MSEQGSAPAVEVRLVEKVDSAVLAAVHHLLPQLSGCALPSGEEVEAMVGQGAARLYIAWIGSRAVGMLTLVIFAIPTGRRAWIEDVVVDGAERGKGIGEALTRAALDAARAEGVRTVDLTSRPTREAANRLYQKVGFKTRETNLYRFDFGGPAGP